MQSPRARQLSDTGVVAGLAVQLVLAALGIATVGTESDAEQLSLVLVWCVIGTAYTVAMLVALTVSSRRRPGEAVEPSARPSALQVNPVVRWLSLGFSLASGLVGLGAAFMVTFSTEDADINDAYKFVGVWAIVLAWGLIHWGFAQWYQVLYYTDPEPGFDFPNTPAPVLLDFVYFAFTVGTSFAASDVTVLNRTQRWRVTLHAILAFFFNSAILVLAFSAATGK